MVSREGSEEDRSRSRPHDRVGVITGQNTHRQNMSPKILRHEQHVEEKMIVFLRVSDRATGSKRRNVATRGRRDGLKEESAINPRKAKSLAWHAVKIGRIVADRTARAILLLSVQIVLRT